LVSFSILLAPSASSKYQATAGRVVQGGVVGEECICGFPGPLPCYDETTWQPCDGSYRSVQEKPNQQPASTDIDTGSIGLLLLTALYMLRRFI
jgi:hypothetical protein